MIKSVAAKSAHSDVHELLDQLEQEVEGIETLVVNSDHQLQQGPYTVFSSKPLSQVTVTEVISYDSLTANPYTSVDPYSDDYVLDTIIEHFGDDHSYRDVINEKCDLSPSSLQGQSNFDLQFEPSSDLAVNNRMVEDVPFSDLDQLYGARAHIPRIRNFDMSSKSPYLPAEMGFLLHHYANHVIDSLSLVPLPRERSPWRGLHLSSAMTAYGELDILGTSSLARVSLLYSLASLTCAHLASMYHSGDEIGPTPNICPETIQTAKHWSENAQKYRNISKTAFRKHLESVAAHPGEKQKYKETLIAAMSLVCCGIISGSVYDSRLYIVHCEEIIRNLGRSKARFSKKALQLHRIFAYISILERTTFLQSPAEYGKLLQNSDLKTTETELALHPLNGPRDLIVNSLQNHRLTAAELQLDFARDPGFESFCGIPGTLFDMLAATNTLIERIGLRTARGTVQYSIPSDLLEEVSQLEQTICNYEFESAASARRLDFLQSPSALAYLDTHEAAADASVVMAFSMRNAIYNALLVYFFREIRNTNPKILQHYVNKVIICLETHQKIKARHYPGTRIGSVVWPGFIVACEALGSDLRHRSMACVRDTVESGFKNGEIAQTVVAEVWRQRDLGQSTVSWREIVRESGVFMLLT